MKDLYIVKNTRKYTNLLYSDYLKLLFNNFQELYGDRVYSNDTSIIGGLAKIDDIPIMIIGQEKGRIIKEKYFYNHGMTFPEGYRKSLRLLKLAEKFNIPVVIFIDTPGAYPGIEAEKRGQASAIAQNLYNMSSLKTIIISIIIGESCSGGALGLAISDKLYMLDKSYFSAITPEGCLSILSKTQNLSHLTEKMNITPSKLLQMKLIDGIISTNFKNINDFILNIKNFIKNEIFMLKKIRLDLLLKKRKKRYYS